MKYKTIEEINALTLQSTFNEVMSRLLDLSSVPPGVLFYEIQNKPELDFYDRVVLHESLEKPPFEDAQAEYLAYKQGLIDSFDAKKAAHDRFKALPDVRPLINRLGLDWPNLKKLEEKIVEELRTDILDQLEAEQVIYAPIKDAEDVIDDDKRKGMIATNACDDCLYVIRGHNSKKNYTKQEIQQMKTTFADILLALTDKMPNEAKALVVAVDNTDFNDLRDKLIKVLEKHGF